MDLRYQNDEVGIIDYFQVLFRRRWIAILTFSVVMVSVAIHTLLATPQFEATGLIEIQDENEKNNVLNELLQIGRTNTVQAEIEVIKSRTLAEMVVHELTLDQRIFEQRPETLRVNLEEVDIHNRLKGKVFSVKFINAEGDFEISSDRLGDLGKGKIGELFSVKDLSLKVMCDQFAPSNSFKFIVYPFRMAVSRIQERTNVKKVGDNTGLVRIIYLSQYPELARDIVNKIIYTYQEKNREERTAEATQTLKFIDDQVNVVRADLSESEIHLNKYKEEHGVMLLDAEATGLIENLAKFEVEKSQIELEKFRYQNLVSMLEKDTKAVNLPNFSKENTVLANLVLELVDLEAKLKNLSTNLTPKHPQVVAAQEQINNIRQSIKDIVKNSVSSFTSREKSIKQIIEKYNDHLKQLPEKERELAGLKRNSAVAAEIYTFLLQKYEEARIAKASTISNIRVIDKAVVPHNPISPNVRLNLMLGLIAGILLAIGVAFFLEFIDDSLKTVDEVERNIRRPIYGIIPRIPDSFQAVDGSKSAAINLVTHYSPKSPISEAFRTLRTNIHFADPDHLITTLLVTSAGPSEGKSTIVSNLAITIANSGRKTLLIDCDLRKPNLHNLFETERDPGLTNILSGKLSIEEGIRKTKIENLSLVTSGPIPPNPTEMVDSMAIRAQVEEFKKDFDMILFDSPPIVAVTDAAIISSYTAGVLLVVELGRSRGASVNRGIDLLDNVKANVLGLVTNNISSGFRYDYGYYYYYYYSSEGDKKRTKRHRTRYGY